MLNLSCKLSTHFFIITSCVAGLSACGGGGGSTSATTSGQSNPATSIAVQQAVLNPGSLNCINGGIEIKTGLDNNFNGILDNNEISNIQAVCNGLDGSDGNTALVNLIDEAAGTNCLAGGKQLQSGKDVDNDGVLSAGEVTSSTYLCHGENGSTGNDGHNSLISSTDEVAGSNCLLGGKRLDSGIDLNNDGILQPGEVNATIYLCSSSSGNTQIFQPLFSIANEPAGSNCPYSGIKISDGLDSNSNGILDTVEISQVSYSCNNGNVLVRTSDEPAGVNCLYGGTRLDAGSDSNANTSLDLSEITSTSYICDDAQDSLVWSGEAQLSTFNPSTGQLQTGGTGGRAAIAGDDNGNALVVTSGQGFITFAGLLKNLKSPVPFAVDIPNIITLSNSTFPRDMLYPAVAAASSPDGRHAIGAYARLNYPGTDFSILLNRYDLTNPAGFFDTVPESVDDGIKEVYSSILDQTVTDLKVAVNNANTTTVAWVENGTQADRQLRFGSDLWVNTYRFVFGSGTSWSGAEKLTTSAVQLQNLVMNDTGSAMIVYYVMGYGAPISTSFRYRNKTLDKWLDPGVPPGFAPSGNFVLASNIDELERVRILYYKNQQIYVNYFDLDSQTWANPQALFTANAITYVKLGGRPNIVVNRQGDVAATDDKGFAYYYDASTGTVDKRFLPSVFPLIVDDETGIAMFGLGGNSGEDMATLSYYPESGWGGAHRVSYTATNQNGEPPAWLFDQYASVTSVSSSGTFRVIADRETYTAIPDLLSKPNAHEFETFVTNVP